MISSAVSSLVYNLKGQCYCKHVTAEGTMKDIIDLQRQWFSLTFATTCTICSETSTIGLPVGFEKNVLLMGWSFVKY